MSVTLLESLNQIINSTNAKAAIFSNDCCVNPCQIIMAINSAIKITLKTIIDNRFETKTLQTIATMANIIIETKAISLVFKSKKLRRILFDVTTYLFGGLVSVSG
jgi:hypothetical protein